MNENMQYQNVSTVNNMIKNVILSRQITKKELEEALFKCNEWLNVLRKQRNWINEHYEELTSDLKGKIEHFRNEIDNLCEEIENLTSTEKGCYGDLTVLLARCERTYISIGAMGAKRQGKGLFLSSMLGLDPRKNDIFLARDANIACTAAVVTLHQGPKKEPVFDQQGNFEKWKELDKNKAIIEFYSLKEMVALIQRYFDAISLKEKFAPNGCNSIDEYKNLCDKWVTRVTNHTKLFKEENDGMSYKRLLLDFLEHVTEYADLLDKELEKIEVPPIPQFDEKELHQYIIKELSQYISYYGRNEDGSEADKFEIKYRALGVKRVDIYTSFSLTGDDVDAFVLSDTPGLGEKKLDLVKNLKSLLSEDIDLAIALYHVGSENNSTIDVKSDIQSFHRVVRDSIVDFPHQVYGVINYSKESYDHWHEKGISRFRQNIIADLRDNEIGIPTTGKVKHHKINEKWNKDEVEEWEKEHFVSLDASNSSAVRDFIVKNVLPNAANNIALVDKVLRMKVMDKVTEISEAYSTLQGSIATTSFDIATTPDEISNKKRKYICETVMVDLKNSLDQLCAELSALSNLSNESKKNNHELPDKLLNCKRTIESFNKNIEKFYCSPDGWHLYFVLSGLELPPSEDFYERKKKAYIALQTSKNKSELQNLQKEWVSENNIINKLSESIYHELISHDNKYADEIICLAECRSRLTKVLCDKAIELVSTDLSSAYNTMQKYLWRIIYEKGRFNVYFENCKSLKLENQSQQINKETEGERVLCALNTSSENNIKGVLEVLKSCLDMTALSKDQDKLKEDFDKYIWDARIQEIRYEIDDDFKKLDNEESRIEMRKRVIPKAIIEHLLSVETDYKKFIARRCSYVRLLEDFVQQFTHAASTINHALLPQGIDNPTTKELKMQFMLFYLNNFEFFFPENDITKEIKLSNLINEFKSIK